MSSVFLRAFLCWIDLDYRLELVSVWPNAQCLAEFLHKEAVQGILTKFKALIGNGGNKKNMRCELYGDVADELVQSVRMVFADVGETRRVDTDAGYILHPKANSGHLE